MTVGPKMSAAGTQADASRGEVPLPQDVEATLADILAGPQFRNSLQCSSFLKYVVKHSLSGEDHLLRERVIGHDVFHRPADYETGEDPVVRIRAAEVRKRLAQYYQTASPAVHIEVPSGSYRAVFRMRQNTPAPAAPPDMVPPVPEPVSPVQLLPTAAPESSAVDRATEPEPLPAVVLQQQAPPAQARSPWKRWTAALLACAALASSATYYGLTSGSPSARVERRFWGPWLDVHRPVLIAMGSNAVYRVSDAVADQYASTHGLPTQGLEVFPPAQALANLHGSDFAPAEQSFVALGDVAAVTGVAAVLAAHGQHFEERFPNDISFAELRGSPTILVGGFNNPTSAELTKALRFRLTRHNEIDDMQNAGRRWVLHASLDSRETEDYAILTRILQQGTDAPMMSIAGMGQYGTQCAGEFIASPTSLAQLDATLGKGWQNRNLQLVLHVKVRDFKPSQPTIVASYTW